VAGLPETWRVPVVRANFSDDDVWGRLKEEIISPTEEGFLAHVEFVEDRALVGLDEAAIVAGYPCLYPHRYRQPVLFVVDHVAVLLPDHPLLVVNLSETDPSGPFRALPRQVQSIENNLSIANMDYVEFARSTDGDGIFRGF
jgi:hypothetical protein